ncbi:hypothetical protein GCM10010124_30840 [Pilimelia terevasa]|uniref:Sensor-like histidine kinase SenX3 n=1 Tax=Pilimelia terevasa TaxID=53372 RepID=A0A8J3BPC9_9ACTN|nr:hypothetical protein GCM10010124_30840 [Pilimelia terevasa]
MEPGSALALAAVTLGLGICLTLAAVAVLERLRGQVASQTMDRQTALAQQAVGAEATRYVDAVGDVAASVGAQAELTTGDFADITAPLAAQRLSGASGVVFVVPAERDRYGAVQRFWRGRGAAGLVFKPAPGDPGGTHMFTVFSRNLDGSAPTLAGIDIRNAPQPSAALTEARRTGQTVVSDTYQLLRDRGLPVDQQQMSFVLAAPVYSPVDSAGGRTFRGWILMGLRGQDFISQTLRSTAQDLLGVTLTTPGAGGAQVTVAKLGDGTGADLHRSVSIPVAQQQWGLHTAATATSLPGSGRSLPIGATATGSAISLLLAVLVYVLLSARARALARVADATAQLRGQERAARDQANLLALIMDSISEAVIVVDRSGQLVHHNSAAAPITGPAGDSAWLASQPAYRLDGSLFDTEDLPWTRAAQRDESVDREEMIIGFRGASDGSVLSVNARPLHHRAARPGAVAVLRDVTARKQHEAQLAVASALLEQELAQRRLTEAKLLEQTEELNIFAGVVAHDLKSPLASVAAYAELLQEESAAPPGEPVRADHGDNVDSILRGIERMRRLIDDLLSYATARDANQKIEEIDLNQAVREVVTERTAHLCAGPTHTSATLPLIDIHAVAVTVRADRAMLRQLLDNLIGNALKYTTPGQPAHVEISAERHADGLVKVVIADHGIGIPTTQHARVFDSFHRAHTTGSYQGTGLGLAICRRIVQRHGGTISVDDNPGGGSRFHFTMPAG